MGRDDGNVFSVRSRLKEENVSSIHLYVECIVAVATNCALEEHGARCVV